MTDDQIIALYWSRKEEAIACTEYAYGSRLLNIAGRILENREDSEECVSDTYMKAWQTIPPQRPTYFFAFLAKICRHLAFGKLDWDNAAKRKAEVVSLYPRCSCASRIKAGSEGWKARRSAIFSMSSWR